MNNHNQPKSDRLTQIFDICRQRYLAAGGDPHKSVNCQQWMTDTEKQEFFSLGNQLIKTSKNYQDYLTVALNDAQRAAGNIQMALEEKERLNGLLKLTLEDIINARKNANNLSKSAQLAYEKLAEILTETNGEETYALIDLLETLGLKLTVIVSE